MWVAWELQRPIKNSRIISTKFKSPAASHVLTKVYSTIQLLGKSKAFATNKSKLMRQSLYVVVRIQITVVRSPETLPCLQACFLTFRIIAGFQNCFSALRLDFWPSGLFFGAPEILSDIHAWSRFLVGLLKFFLAFRPLPDIRMCVKIVALLIVLLLHLYCRIYSSL